MTAQSGWASMAWPKWCVKTQSYTHPATHLQEAVVTDTGFFCVHSNDDFISLSRLSLFWFAFRSYIYEASWSSNYSQLHWFDVVVREQAVAVILGELKESLLGPITNRTCNKGNTGCTESKKMWDLWPTNYYFLFQSPSKKQKHSHTELRYTLVHDPETSITQINM